VSFFPEVEPDFMQVQIRARDNFSIFEKDALVRRVETRLLDGAGIASVYARSGSTRQQDAEVIGTIQLELTDWDRRAPAAQIAERIRRDMADIPGIEVQVQSQQHGPGQGKPVRLEIAGPDRADRDKVIETALTRMEEIGGFTDVTDSRPLPGVEWRVALDRSEAARAGADVTLLGQAVQLLTQGITVADYRPDDAEGAVDIRVRFPSGDRTLEELRNLRVPTSRGLVPVAHFVTFEPVPRSGEITRIDQRRISTVAADVAPDRLVSAQIEALRAALAEADLPADVAWSFAGEAEDQRAATQFLTRAFIAAIFLMTLILVTQFNSFYQAFVVMSAIVFSIAGVLLGLLVTGRPFGVVMGGIGVIALAGIVVNNNIVLIDTYNALRAEGMPAREAALRTGAQRLRPVVLTTVTTVLGLMPMVVGVNIDFLRREIVYGAPSTQWWTELSSAIAGGLVVATVLTLVVTPAMLMLGERLRRGLFARLFRGRRGAGNRRAAAAPGA
jgi:multidrug efflux pump